MHLQLICPLVLITTLTAPYMDQASDSQDPQPYAKKIVL
jgi:hypothetical protein